MQDYTEFSKVIVIAPAPNIGPYLHHIVHTFYFLWNIQNHLGGTKCNTFDELKIKNVSDYFRSKPEEFYNSGIFQLHFR